MDRIKKNKIKKNIKLANIFAWVLISIFFSTVIFVLIINDLPKIMFFIAIFSLFTGTTITVFISGYNHDLKMIVSDQRKRKNAQYSIWIWNFLKSGELAKAREIYDLMETCDAKFLFKGAILFGYEIDETKKYDLMRLPSEVIDEMITNKWGM